MHVEGRYICLKFSWKFNFFNWTDNGVCLTTFYKFKEYLILILSNKDQFSGFGTLHKQPSYFVSTLVAFGWLHIHSSSSLILLYILNSFRSNTICPGTSRAWFHHWPLCVTHYFCWFYLKDSTGSIRSSTSVNDDLFIIEYFKVAQINQFAFLPVVA